jgi:hypothetical protein
VWTSAQFNPAVGHGAVREPDVPVLLPVAAAAGAGDALGLLLASAAGDALAVGVLPEVLVERTVGVKSIQSARPVITMIKSNRLISRLRTAGACLLEHMVMLLRWCQNPIHVVFA